MLFNSYAFLWGFLPLTCVVFFALCSAGWVRAAASWLAIASLVFYSYWSPQYLALLLGSIAVNFTAGRLLLSALGRGNISTSKILLVTSVAINVIALGYFKYVNFFVDAVNDIGNFGIHVAAIALPIGISFFTFTQIAFLVDTFQGKVREARFVPYLLFVTYFPHLVAGPVLHHAEMMPQFGRAETFRFQINNVVSGMILLLIGLFKKVILADGIQPFVAPAFDGSHINTLTMLEAWGAVFAYTLQLYFDFSGYSDMAIGMSRIFNVELPLNFDSPYKSRNIAEFWRRWHMTLSRFLRDYLYIPLGGNRLGSSRRFVNLATTMVLGGLWHGAGWTFVIWGALHGAYLIINQAWQAIANEGRMMLFMRTRAASAASIWLTFLAVTVAWTFFRAESLSSAKRMLVAMAGGNGLVLPIEWKESLTTLPGNAVAGLRFDDLTAFAGTRQLTWIALLMFFVWFCPNSQQLMARFAARGKTFQGALLSWSILGAVVVLIAFLAMINASHGASEFIYFNF